MISSLRSCGRKFELEHILNYRPASESVHLHAGGAYAKALETTRVAYFTEGLPAPDAIAAGLKSLMVTYGDFECPPDSAKSLERMLGAFEFHFEQYPLETEEMIPITLPSGSRGVEFSFAEPLDINHPETGDPLIYVGRMDQVCEYAGSVFGFDDKTTSQLGASWAKQWDLRSQFTGYCWGAQRGGVPLTGFIVRGVSILKTKYDTQQAITYRPAWQIERWYEQTLRDIRKAISMWESGGYDYSLDHACAEYGGCPFRQVCLSQDPSNWLATSFVREHWNPLTRERTVL